MLKTAGWIVASLTLLFTIFFIYLIYFPTKRLLNEAKKELTMWEDVVRREGEHIRVWSFPVPKFFEKDGLSLKGEVMLAMILDSLEVYGRDRKLTMVSKGPEEEILTWFNRLDRVLNFITRNCSLSGREMNLRFTPSKEESFAIIIDD
ncbi:MAG TPA: hypothetical protein EYP24_00060 [bacterium (Candidatus Stahlbacteria)]|nr:hypothetical protein [Candidatus Stahlbacteria bacterium]